MALREGNSGRSLDKKNEGLKPKVRMKINCHGLKAMAIKIYLINQLS